MKLPRRQFLHLATGFAALPTLSGVASAQAYPTRPVRIVVPFPAGNAPDIVARLIAQSLSTRLGQQFIVENRPGAAGNIGTEAVVRAPPDGHTLLVVTSTTATNATFYDNLAFDLLRDIAPVASTFRSSNVLAVNMAVPAKTLPEFIAYAKANPGKINYASAGTGSAPNVAGELFKTMAGVDMVHVPYRGSFIPDLVGGQVQAAFTPIASAAEQIRAGRLRAVAVTGATRSDALPDVPAVGEFVPGYQAYIWDGIGAPRDTPTEIIDKLNQEINGVLSDADMKARLAALGAEPMQKTPVEFRNFISAEVEKWGKVIRAANMKPE
jgi:tripartite-type tricarboxylate transporter receptor subunit TctC